MVVEVGGECLVVGRYPLSVPELLPLELLLLQLLGRGGLPESGRDLTLTDSVRHFLFN